MKIDWQVEDGVIDRGRPHTFKIPDSEIKKCNNRNEALNLVMEYVDNEFNDKISWFFINFESLYKDIGELLGD